MIVVIDDERTFDWDKDAIYIRTNAKALAWASRYWSDYILAPVAEMFPAIEELWLDHDLGDGSQDYPAIVKFLEATALEPTTKFPVNKIYVHTQNPVGAENILRALSAYDTQRVELPALVDTSSVLTW